MKVHFIGIGGIGVSALAQYYLARGHEVSGSDLVRSEIVDFLERKGIKIVKKIPKAVDLVIYSPAVPLNQLPRLLNQPRELIKLSYPEALGELTKKYFTIAISGTHGKSTTTAMIALILIKAGFDPTVIVGTRLKEFGNSNFRMGRGKYLVIEADEWQASFLNYWPKIIVLTNIEREHLDYYKNMKHILKTYKEFISHLPKNGILIDARKYSLKQKEAKKLRKILKIPGEHNILNALAALAAARALGISDKVSFKALSEYRGAWRRFEIKKSGKITVISDYGHHPTEIEATLKAARQKFPKQKIWCVFQPHQYQRTFYLFDDFVKVFSKAPVDKLIITDIYDVAGRERGDIKKKVNSEKLIKKINKPWLEYLPKNKIKNYLERNLKGGEIVIIMGAGDIYKLADEFSTSPLDRGKQK